MASNRPRERRARRVKKNISNTASIGESTKWLIAALLSTYWPGYWSEIQPGVKWLVLNRIITRPWRHFARPIYRRGDIRRASQLSRLVAAAVTLNAERLVC